MHTGLCETEIPESLKRSREKFHMQDRHPKWLNIIYFFYVKMYRVLLKVLARKGEKILHTRREGRLPGQERMTWRDPKACRPLPSLTSHQEQYKEVTKQEKQI